MDQARIEQIKQRVEAATPGPWETNKLTHWPSWYSVVAIGKDHGHIADVQRWRHGVAGSVAENEANAAFIAHARQDVPDLLAALAEAQATIQRQAAELAEARKDQAWMRKVDQFYGESLSALPAWSDETASLADNIRHMAEELSRLRRLLKDITQAFSPDGCGCIKDIPGDNYTCTAHQRLRKIALDAAKEAGNAGS
jgi:hypothetical protein